MDNFFEQIVNISKAGAYDIVSKQAQELTEENKKLRERVKYLEKLIDEYTGKMLVNLSGVDYGSSKVNKFLGQEDLMKQLRQSETF